VVIVNSTGGSAILLKPLLRGQSVVDLLRAIALLSIQGVMSWMWQLPRGDLWRAIGGRRYGERTFGGRRSDLLGSLSRAGKITGCKRLLRSCV